MGEVIVSELFIKETTNTIYGTLYMPEGEGRHPAVIVSHGFNGSGKDFAEECMAFAKKGYVAYAFDFCGGSNTSRSSGCTEKMSVLTELEDLKTVFSYIRKMPAVDEKNIVLFGESQGGLVTALCAEELQDQVRGLMLYYPALCIPDDWKKSFPDWKNAPETFEFWGVKLGKKYLEDLARLDVFQTIGGFGGRVLIFHGTEDPTVDLSYSQRAEKKYKNGELVIFEGEGHGFGRKAAQAAIEKMLLWLAEEG